MTIKNVRWMWLLTVIAGGPDASAADWTKTLRSPDGQIEVRIDGGEALRYSVSLGTFEKWGIKGIKADFMQRDDQKLIDFYHRACAAAAKRKMLVDFHGTNRTALMTRTWPNLISTEGVRGLEQAKWSEFANPEHDLTLPFTRMFLGPMDYTPGAMVNASKKNFVKVFDAPMSMGTRAHQLAMYVVFESPLQMLADTPSNYLREPEAMEFLGPVPSVWSDTQRLKRSVDRSTKLRIRRSEGGGWAARVTPSN